MKVFDAHCHLQDPRILSKASQLIAEAQKVGVVGFVVNGVSEKDWHLVKELGQSHPTSILPCFGVHPWFIMERTPNWFDTLKQFFESTPSAAVGEIGLDKGSKGKQIDFAEQIQVFEQQLQLAKDLKRPASIHCVRAFGDLLPIAQRVGPFPAGLILHSYMGSAEMVREFVKLGAYFSFSGFIMSMEPRKAKKMLKTVPSERILLETDAPDALPNNASDSLFLVDRDSSDFKSASDSSNLTEGESSGSKELCALEEKSSPSTIPGSSPPKETLNHPANILSVLAYLASLLEMTKEEVAEASYQNAIRLFSYRDQLK